MFLFCLRRAACGLIHFKFFYLTFSQCNKLITFRSCGARKRVGHGGADACVTDAQRDVAQVSGAANEIHEYTVLVGKFVNIIFDFPICRIVGDVVV